MQGTVVLTQRSMALMLSSVTLAGVAVSRKTWQGFEPPPLKLPGLPPVIIHLVQRAPEFHPDVVHSPQPAQLSPTFEPVADPPPCLSSHIMEANKFGVYLFYAFVTFCTTESMYRRGVNIYRLFSCTQARPRCPACLLALAVRRNSR